MAYIWDERALIGNNILFTGRSTRGHVHVRGSLQYIAWVEAYFNALYEIFVSFYCLLNLFMSPGEVKYIGPLGGEKQSYIGLHLDSPGNFCLYGILLFVWILENYSLKSEHLTRSTHSEASGLSYRIIVIFLTNHRPLNTCNQCYFT